jgi:hypothetical protein
MAVGYVTVVLRIVILVTGLVLALGLKRRDWGAAAFVAAGLGTEIIVELLVIAQAPVEYAVRNNMLIMVFTVVEALLRVAGYALIVVGLLRVIRGPRTTSGPPVSPGPPGPPGPGPYGPPAGPYGPAGVNR